MQEPQASPNCPRHAMPPTLTIATPTINPENSLFFEKSPSPFCRDLGTNQLIQAWRRGALKCLGAPQVIIAALVTMNGPSSNRRRLSQRASALQRAGIRDNPRARSQRKCLLADFSTNDSCAATVFNPPASCGLGCQNASPPAPASQQHSRLHASCIRAERHACGMASVEQQSVDSAQLRQLLQLRSSDGFSKTARNSSRFSRSIPIAVRASVGFCEVPR